MEEKDDVVDSITLQRIEQAACENTALIKKLTRVIRMLLHVCDGGFLVHLDSGVRKGLLCTTHVINVLYRMLEVRVFMYS